MARHWLVLPDPNWLRSVHHHARYERLLRIARKRLAQEEDSYVMRATARIIASQRRRRG